MRVLAGGRAFINGELRQVDIGFEEQILAVGEDLQGEKIDCEGLLILPAMIDVHVHFRDFNQAYKEDWQSGSKAAVKGGVATVMEMPNTDPPTATLEIIRRKRELADSSSVSYGIYGGLTEDNIDLIPELAREVEAFKLYMGPTTGRLEVADLKTQREIFKTVATTGKVLAVHAQTHGGAAEPRELERAIDLAIRCDVKLHLVHLTTQAGVELAAEAKEDLDLTVETCPHYLVFTEEDFVKRGALLKVSPSLATAEDRGFLWEALQEGLIDILASDHAPHTIEEKSQGIADAPSGLPGVETTLPLMLDAVNQGKIALSRLVKLFSWNPRKRFDFERKGKTGIGCDADLVVIDMSRQAKVKRADLATKCGWSPYEDMVLQGWPLRTFMKGEPVYESE